MPLHEEEPAVSDADGPERTTKPGVVPVEGGGIFQSRADGQLHFTPESVGSTNPIAAPIDATPLEEDEPEGIIPPSPLWAMKDRRHEQWVMFGHADRVRSRFGTDDGTVYAIDDGKHHCMIGRGWGPHSTAACIASSPGSTVTRTRRWRPRHHRPGRICPWPEPALVATAEGDGVSNLFDIDNYHHRRHPEPLSPAPRIHRVRPGSARRRPLTGDTDPGRQRARGPSL